MIPKWGKKAPPSIAPKFDELISILQCAQTFNSTSSSHPDATNNVNKRLSDNNDYDDDEKKSISITPASASQSSMMQLMSNYGGPTDKTTYQQRNQQIDM